MRALLPRPAENVDVHAYYAAGWTDRGGWRVNFVASADGAATAKGLSRGLQTPGDNEVFAALRDLADVVVVGARTATAEGYGPARLSTARVARRHSLGLPASLPIAVVSARLHLDPRSELYTDRAAHTIVITCAAAPADTRAALAETAEVLVCGDREVDMVAARSALVDRGLTRILCEGGPHLFGSTLRAGVVDEFCLSLTPMLAGPGAGRVVAGSEVAAATGLDLVGLLEEDGALFFRYAVPRAAVT